jgi:hypothetical protein
VVSGFLDTYRALWATKEVFDKLQKIFNPKAKQALMQQRKMNYIPIHLLGFPPSTCQAGRPADQG